MTTERCQRWPCDELEFCYCRKGVRPIPPRQVSVSPEVTEKCGTNPTHLGFKVHQSTDLDPS